MHVDPGTTRLDTIHESISSLISSLMGAATQRSAPAPHVSFLALGASNAQAFELIQILNAVFGLDLPSDSVLKSPTPDALARGIEAAWFEADGSAEELAERLLALTDDE
jgi:Phosphopantetheine attachment site